MPGSPALPNVDPEPMRRRHNRGMAPLLGPTPAGREPTLRPEDPNMAGVHARIRLGDGIS